MITAYLEHTNITVSDPDKTAQLLCALFDWDIRWSGPAKDGGYTVHIGDKASYLALYRPAADLRTRAQESDAVLALNHVGVVVSDLERLESNVVAAGLKPYNHGVYKPGRRFYFNTDDELEIEVVSYNPSPDGYWSFLSQHK